MSDMFWFGLTPDEALVQRRGLPLRSWGARAIFKPQDKWAIDLLPDRQQWEPALEKHNPLDVQFATWVDKTLLTQLNQEAKKNLDPRGREVVEIISGRYMCRASTNASHGYLYIGVWEFALNTHKEDTDKEVFGVSATLLDGETEEGRPVYMVQNGNRIIVSKWSGKIPLPPIGAEVNVNLNRIGRASVRGYFHDHGWLGVECAPYEPPDWFNDQNGPGTNAMVFGADLKAD